MILRNAEGTAVLHFKPWCTTQCEDEAYETVELLRTIPTDLPDVIKPNYSMVDKCTSNGVFKTIEKEWMKFLTNEQHQAELYEGVERNLGR